MCLPKAFSFLFVSFLCKKATNVLVPSLCRKSTSSSIIWDCKVQGNNNTCIVLSYISFLLAAKSTLVVQKVKDLQKSTYDYRIHVGGFLKL